VANEEHLRIIEEGVLAWNHWRWENPGIKPDLEDADLSEADLSEINLREANMSRVDLRNAQLNEADLSGAVLIEAILNGVDFTNANLYGADLSGAIAWHANFSRANLEEANLSKSRLFFANLSGIDLSGVDFSGADLSIANLNRTILIETNFNKATLRGCKVYGISAWGLKLDEANQSDLIITRRDEPKITVDNLEVAQFIYLLLHSQKIRYVIDTIAKKAVLILGSFKEERKSVLDTIRDELRKQDYLPIVFDFDGPASRDTAETISTLAHLSRFIIADITEPRSVPAELAHVVEKLPSVAVQPLMLSSDYEYELFKHIKRYPWVLPVYLYDSQEMLLANLKEHVIDPAEAKARELIPPAVNR